MGILTRLQGEVFVITSDRSTDAAPTARPPARMTDVYQVWTGACWSTSKTDAIGFVSLDEADEYVRANFAKVTA